MCIDIECVESSSDEDIFEDDTSMTPVSSSPCVEHSVERRPSHSHNPWILHCHRGHIAKMLGLDVDATHSHQSHSQCHFENLPSFEFLLLENLTWRYINLVDVVRTHFYPLNIIEIIDGNDLVSWISKWELDSMVMTLRNRNVVVKV